MSRHKTRTRIAVEYYPLYSLLLIIKSLPLPWAKRLTSGLMSLAFRVAGKRRHLIEAQISACFPDLPVLERADIAKRSLTNLSDGLAIFPRIPQLVVPKEGGIVETEGFEHLDAALKKGKGVITFTAHYGCWEIMAVYVTRHYKNVAMVVRPLDNPRLDALVTSIRSSGGGSVIDSSRVFKEGLRLLRNNGILGVLIDQNFYKGGVFVDFFGRLAATNTLVPILAHRTECVVLPMHNVWSGGKVKIICEPPIELSNTGDAARDIQADTQRLTKVVERWIKEDPSQWMWLHNRWKRRPEPAELPPNPL